MTDNSFYANRLIHPPAMSAAAAPSSLSQVADILAQISTTTLSDASFQEPDAAQWLEVAARLSAKHDATHLWSPFELDLPRLQRLLIALDERPRGLRLSLACSLDAADESNFSVANKNAAVVQIRWRLTGGTPDFRLLKAFSRAGIWNHLVLDGPAAAAPICSAVARQPNIVHSWEATAPDEPACGSVATYPGVTPLPGRALWQSLDDPVHRFVLADLFGKDWLSRSRVDEVGDRLYRTGESLAYHFCPPDRLPDGYLDEICAMVAAGGTVAMTHVRANLEHAFLIGYVIERDRIVGNSSLKHPRPAYIEAVHRQSGLDLSGFVERGYTSVRPEYRGLGIGTRLLEGLTARAGGRKIFSVIAEDNEATKIIARRNQTRQVATYFSQKAGKAVGIWMPAGMIDGPGKETL